MSAACGVCGQPRAEHQPHAIARLIADSEPRGIVCFRYRGPKHPVHQPGECPRCDADNRLYERAEDCVMQDIPLEEALQTVRNGYSSIEADRLVALDP